MKTIELVEYEGVKLAALNEEIINEILKVRKIKIKNGKIIPNGISGYIKFKDYEIIFLPKISKDDYLKMLYKLGFIELAGEKIEFNQMLYNIVLDYANKLLEISKKYGPPIEYINTKIEEAVVKGKIEIGDSVNPPKLKQTRWIIGQGKISGILVGALTYAYNIFKTDELFYLLSKVKTIFFEAKAIFKPQRNLNVPEEYSYLVRMANFILESKLLTLGEGFFIDNQKLFELFVYRELYENYFTLYQQELKVDKIIIRPDFIVEGIPIDAKYRFSIENRDIYQAFTYAKLFKKNYIILIYPYLEYELNLEDVKIKSIAIFRSSLSNLQ